MNKTITGLALSISTTLATDPRPIPKRLGLIGVGLPRAGPFGTGDARRTTASGAGSLGLRARTCNQGR
ncbi:MAG: hypothetical protein WBM40_11915, partial [Thiohalocapsa sp.]